MGITHREGQKAVDIDKLMDTEEIKRVYDLIENNADPTHTHSLVRAAYGWSWHGGANDPDFSDGRDWMQYEAAIVVAFILAYRILPDADIRMTSGGFFIASNF